MFAFRLCRITATLIHRAYFLLLADFFIGSRWFMINGFGVCWLMAHFLSTKQIWFNGVVVELFVLVQLLGYLSNLAFTTSGQFYPLAIAAVLYLLVDSYRYYIQQLRLQDPEQTFYSFSCLRKPFVPRRALQIIQITPMIYTLLHLTRNGFEEANYFRFKYSLGMADAIVFVAINLDLGLVVLTRFTGTLRHVYQEMSWRNVGFCCRFNLSGSYSFLARDFGWKAVPTDQLHVSWIVYWSMKLILIVILYLRLETTTMTFQQFVIAELLSNFVAATATVYLACLVTGFLLSAAASFFTYAADVMSCSSVCQGSYDTVQHIRWMALKDGVCPPDQVGLLIDALLYAHLPLCAKLIQNVGEICRRKCCCLQQAWTSTLGGILAILFFLLYSFLVYYHVSSITFPVVSTCFAKSTELMTGLWLCFNGLISVSEVMTLIVCQGLVDTWSKRNLDKGTRIYRNCMSALLAISLTAVNVYSFMVANSGSLDSVSCGPKDMIHDGLQIFSRSVFIWFTIRQASGCASSCSSARDICGADTCTLSSVWEEPQCAAQSSPCGLCYNSSDRDHLMQLNCGHSFHRDCFSSWRNCGSQCPVCRKNFRRPDVLLAYYSCH
ncbi:hypothetical protein RvY_18851 [Ramazzottius varieornatus]|uniref:RING-type domain-containing protein n=1 Tax=Ramazzottius varieornatus TaxID=947166 RepID=A0A1D1W7A5_RAMVA|nr:hypothetical protein RvY_18851 [Ramazzottius varieornatus]